jgi:hypothetical protein
MSRTRHKHKPYAQPIITRTRHQSIRPVNETFVPSIPVIQRNPDRWEAIVCLRNGVQRFYAESADFAEERALAVVSNFNFHNFNNFNQPESREKEY